LIFLTVGNWHKGFDRLVRAVDELVESGTVTEKVIAQTGHSSYTPMYLEVTDYCSPTKFIDIMAKSRVIITHAGIGTVGQAISLGKPVIVLPRKSNLGECGDNHQWTTAKQLEKEGKILVAYDVSELPDKLQQAKDFIPAKRHNAEKIIHAVETFLKELVAKKCKG
jgi:UDP-N-acetylglucosamine transferase subunit ALG13